MRTVAQLRIVMGTLAPVWLAACGIYGPCDHQRGIELYGRVDGGDVREASQTTPLSMVAFWEHQRGDRRVVIWYILGPQLRGRPTVAHLHEGSAESGDGVRLYTFPIENSNPAMPSGQDTVMRVTSGSVDRFSMGTPGGAVPLEDLMQRMYQGPTYLEVHTDSVPGGEFRAQLGTPRFFRPPEDPAVWQPTYCS